jgi:hypothetical protein
MLHNEELDDLYRSQVFIVRVHVTEMRENMKRIQKFGGNVKIWKT